MKYFNKSGKKLETLTKHTIQNFKRKTLGGVTTTKLSIDQQSLLVHIAALLCKENSAQSETDRQVLFHLINSY